MQLLGEFKGIAFTKEQLVFTDEEYVSIATEFWPGAPISEEQLTDQDRAFIQVALLVAVDTSEKAGFLFDLWSSFMRAAPSQSLQKLVKALAKKTANRWFKKFIDDTPKVSAVGKAAVQYGAFITEWRLRVGVGDPSMLTNFLTH